MCELVEGAELSALDDAALSALVADLEVRAARLDAERLRVLGEWDARAGWAADGAASGASWVAGRGYTARPVAAGWLRDARQLRTMPETSAAVAEGRLAPAKARLLCRAVNGRTRAAFTRDEEMLVRVLAGLRVDQAAIAVRYWLAHADSDGPEPDDRDRNGVWFSQTTGGRWRLKGDLDQESGAIVSGVLDGLVERARRELREAAVDLAGSGPRLRADALVDMARRCTAAPDTAAAAHPLVWVLAGADELETGEGVAELHGVGPLSAMAARRLACDGDVATVVVDADRTQLRLNRTQRRASGTQRRLLALRDGGCRFPGCDRPPGWCEAHHLVFWEHGGLTELSNLVLLCSFHHHLCHEGGYRAATVSGGEVVFHRPDGTRIDPPPIAA